MATKDLRQSIQPTYDSRETGPRYNITTRIEHRTIEFRTPLYDPFVRHTVTIGCLDLLRGLLRRRLTVTVILDGDGDVIDDVLELDANTLIPDSTRHRDFHQDVVRAFLHQETNS